MNGTDMKEHLKTVLRKLGLLRTAFLLYEKSLRLKHGGSEPALTGQFPLPPADLRIKVAGFQDGRWFLESGQRAFDGIQACLKAGAIEVDRLVAILDFGCGCGRILRYWGNLPAIEVHGCDYNPDLTRWCEKNLPFGRYAVNTLTPPTVYPPHKFGLVYAISVFTHLPEALQLAWMKELRRILVPTGYLIFSTHGDHYQDQAKFTASERREFQEGKLLVRYQEMAGTNLCSAFHPEQYVRRVLAEGFEVVDYLPEGAQGNPSQQGLYLLRAKPEAL